MEEDFTFLITLLAVKRSYLKTLLNETDYKFFPVKDALMFTKERLQLLSRKVNLLYKADNPPFGATFTYYIKRSTKNSKAAKDRIKEKELIKKNEPVYYPSFDDLREEDDEEKPLFTVY
ncbi:MAG: hypothetical protein MZV64_05510 [Ignavibacteriales bacterium]|nr:hypothetical protein [Ignavibacteriales bacterium]